MEEEVSGSSRDALIQTMMRSVRVAYLAFAYAESKAGKKLQDQEAYGLLGEEGIPDAAIARWIGAKRLARQVSDPTDIGLTLPSHVAAQRLGNVATCVGTQSHLGQPGPSGLSQQTIGPATFRICHLPLGPVAHTAFGREECVF